MARSSPAAPRIRSSSASRCASAWCSSSSRRSTPRRTTPISTGATPSSSPATAAAASALASTASASPADPEHVSPDLFPAARSTTLPGGYMGKLLRVDLTAGTCTDENLPEEALLRKLWGGQALASYILMHELPLDAKALEPENVVVGLTGPITGNGFTPGATKTCAVYLSPATHYTLGRGATSGFWGTAIKAAGYDGFIITGASPRPVYLYLNDGQADLRHAGAVWGLGTRATEDALKREVGRQDARVGCIGPAGENLVHAAMLVNDYNHVAAHGLGAVMGSKKLKAIVAWGTRRPPIRDKAALVEAGNRWRGTIQPYTEKQRRYKLD